MSYPDTPWIAQEPLSELSLYSDWDSMASMVESLRIYMFDYGTIPVSNFMLCGGLPELSVPGSWAWTWPSLFAYALPGNAAIAAAWLFMTFVGFASLQEVLTRWTGSRFGSLVGAGVFVLSGVFAHAFNRGHVTWAFFHLIPLSLLAFELAFSSGIARRASLGALAFCTFSSFLLFSGGLPHALFYLYPGFAILVALRIGVGALAVGPGPALRAALLPLAAHGLGLWLAAYKLWPVIAWQLDLPRAGVGTPSATLASRFLLTLVWPYAQLAQQRYLPYIGPIPWAIALGAVCVWAVRASRRGRAALLGEGDASALYGLVIVALGLLLSMGSGNPKSPAYLFPHLPLLGGIRGFVRYEALTALGVAILVAYGLGLAARGLRGASGVWQWVALASLALAALGPVAAQAADAVWHIRYLTHAEILALYEAELEPESELPDPPALMMTPRRSYYPERTATPAHQAALLSAGHWISNCRTDLRLSSGGEPPQRKGRPRKPVVRPLSRPQGEVERITPNSLTLGYSESPAGAVKLLLPASSNVTFDPPEKSRSERWSVFRTQDLLDGRLTLTAHPRGVVEGAWASAAGVVASALFFGALVLRPSGSGRSSRG